MRILIVGTPHGNERLGLRLYRHIQRHQPQMLPHIDYICGNPKAYRKNVRFIETDFNRSFGVAVPRSYEEKRAAKVLRHIQQGNYDIVLDVHTTVAPLDRFFLATSLNAAIRTAIGAAPISRVAIMPPDIADCSLIGNVPQAISLEYNYQLAATKKALDELVTMLENLLRGSAMGLQREAFFVDGKIALDAPIAADAQNFSMCNLGFYPVLLDYGSYGTFRGFCAHKKSLFVV